MILIRNLPTKVVSCHNIWMNFFTVLHHKNKYGQTLLKILTSQGHTMKAYLDILLKMERSYHQSLNEYTKCLKRNLGTSDITLEAVLEGRATYKPSELTTVWIWMRILIQFVVPFTVLVSDIVLDALLVAQYWKIYQSKSFTIPYWSIEGFENSQISTFQIWPVWQLKTATKERVWSRWTPAAATTTSCPTLPTLATSWRFAPGSSSPWHSCCHQWHSTSWNGATMAALAMGI